MKDQAWNAVPEDDSPPPVGEDIQTTKRDDEEEKQPISGPFGLTVIFLFFFFDTICSMGAMSIGLLVYIPWGLSLISYANAYLIAFSLSVFTQVIVAFFSDRIVTRFGRRKPFVVLSNALRYISFLCLAHPPSDDPDHLAGWFTTFYALYMISNAIGTNPFASWLIESTKDQADYTRIYSVAVPLGGVLGGLLGLGLLEVNPSAAAILTTFGGAFFTGMLLFFIPSRVYRESPRVPDMIPSIRICSQSAEFRRIFLVTVCFNAAMGVMGTCQLFLYYTTFDIAHLTFINELLLATALVSGSLGMALNVGCNWLLQKTDKIKVFMTISIFVAVLASANFFTTFSDGGLYASFLFSAGVAAAYAPILLISQLFLRDLVVYDTFGTGCNRENMYLTAMTVPASILANFIGGVPTVLLSLSGFHSLSSEDAQEDDLVTHKYVWTPFSQWLVRLFACVGVSLLVLQCFRLLSDYALTTKVVEQLHTVNNERSVAKETQQRQDALEAFENRNNTLTAETTTAANAQTERELEEQLLMHFSASELHFLVDSDETLSAVDLRQRLVHILTQVFHGVCSAIVVFVFLITALVFDGKYLNGLFSTLLIYCVLLSAFYVFFEVSRWQAGVKLMQWPSETLRDRAQAVHEEYTRKKAETLEHLLHRHGIAVGGGAVSAEETENVVNPIHDSEAIPSDEAQEKEDEQNEAQAKAPPVTRKESNKKPTVSNVFMDILSGKWFASSGVFDSGEKLNTMQIVEKDYSRVSFMFAGLGFLSVLVIMLAGIKP